MKIRPLDDRIVIEVHEAEETTTGGIVLPDTAKDKPQQGTVKAMGPGKAMKDGNRMSFSVEEGDTVLFGKYSGTDVKIDGDEFKIMRESDLLGKYLN